MRDPSIAAAIILGDMHLEIGLLVSPAADISIPIGNNEALADFIDLIWYAGKRLVRSIR